MRTCPRASVPNSQTVAARSGQRRVVAEGSRAHARKDQGAGRGVPLAAASVPAASATPLALVFGPCDGVSPPETVPPSAFAPVGVHPSLSRVWPWTTPTPSRRGGVTPHHSWSGGVRTRGGLLRQPPRARNGACAHRLRSVVRARVRAAAATARAWRRMRVAVGHTHPPAAEGVTPTALRWTCARVAGWESNRRAR